MRFSVTRSKFSGRAKDGAEAVEFLGEINLCVAVPGLGSGCGIEVPPSHPTL
jgi:hypothetical protein